MGIFRKSMSEIENIYNDAKMSNETIEMYQMAKKIMEKGLKETDKLQNKLFEIQRKKDHKITECENIKQEMKKMREKHPIKSNLARIPLIGRIPELIGNIGQLPVMRSIPFVKELGEVGSVERKYHRLKAQLKQAKERKRIYERNEKDLAPVVKKCTKQNALDERDVERCAKAVRKCYKIDKPNIEISTLFEKKKNMLEKAFDDKTMSYIQKYVEAIRSGKECKLPKGIESPAELVNKIKEGIRNKQRGIKVEAIEVEESKKADKKQNNFKADIKESGFANSTMDRRVLEDMDVILVGNEKASPEEFMIFWGYVADKMSDADNVTMEDVKKAFNDDKENYCEKGIEVFEEMIEKINNGEVDDKTKLSKRENLLYVSAKNYMQKLEEQKMKRSQSRQTAKDGQQIAI